MFNNNDYVVHPRAGVCRIDPWFKETGCILHSSAVRKCFRKNLSSSRKCGRTDTKYHEQRGCPEYS